MPVIPDMISEPKPIETSVIRTRTTLSVRLGSGSRTEAGPSVIRRVTGDAALAGQNGVVPLKRLTAGRKEIKIAHDGATYLLRITKSNKLILTKTEATQPSATSSKPSV